MLQAYCDIWPALRRVGFGCVLAITVCLCAVGCVERRLMVRTNPPGALLYVDDYEIGATPIATNFTYYGNRKIRLVKDGYETLTVVEPIPPPWYQITPLDFFSENLVPGQIRDQRTLDFQLVPQAVVPPEQLLSRAEALRRGAHAAAVAPDAAAPAIRVDAAPRYTPAAVAPPIAAPAASGQALPAPQNYGGQPLYPLPPR
jgi:hypothetical protein